MVKRICVVDLSTRLVVNVIEQGAVQASANVVEATSPPPDFSWVEHSTAGIGWSMDGAGNLNAPPVPQETPQQLQAAIEARLQAEMDMAARVRGYDDLRAAISYRGSSNPTWDHEGTSFFAWRDAVWAKAISVLGQVAAGTAKMPTPDEAAAMMPALPI